MSEPIDISKEALKKRQEELPWNCRFHPTHWWHETGCPHMEWTVEQLLSAVVTKKESDSIMYDRYIEATKEIAELKTKLEERK